MMSSEDSWIFDSLVNYLAGPVWNLPICNFIEHKSVIFENDPSKDDEYKKIHDEYKNLVDFMLGTYMEDLQITPEQFEASCGQSSANIKKSPLQAKFEQVWAADDFDIFRRMMIEKNLDLQLQVLEVLHRTHGIVPASFVSDDGVSPDEEAVMNEVIRKSLEEHEAAKGVEDGAEEDVVKKVIENSLEEQERIRNELEHLKDGDIAVGSTQFLPAEKHPDVSPEDLQKRQEHLRAQRDKLLELKRQERENQLRKFEASTPHPRPKSSKAARKALGGGNVGPQALQFRRTLVERLKNEVINQN